MYDVLNSKMSDPISVIKHNWRTLAKKYHPDKNPGNPEFSSKMCIDINSAMEILSDPIQREDYDRKISEKSNNNFPSSSSPTLNPTAQEYPSSYPTFAHEYKNYKFSKANSPPRWASITAWTIKLLPVVSFCYVIDNIFLYKKPQPIEHVFIRRLRRPLVDIFHILFNRR